MFQDAPVDVQDTDPPALAPPSSRCKRLWRRLALLLVAGVGAHLLLVLGIAQDHFLTAPLAYLPQQFPSLLLVGMALLGGFWNRRLAAVLLGVAALPPLLLYPWKGPAPPPSLARPSPPALRVAFANRGDQRTAAWNTWLARERPDLVAMTDIGFAHRTMSIEGPETGGLPFLLRVGEHVLASRYPFQGSQVLRPAPSSDPAQQLRFGYLPAARFQVDAPGGPIAVYVVHIRSPRDALSKYRSPLLWRWTLLGPPAGRPASITIDHYWREQRAVIDFLLRQIAADPLPALVLGDWNVPDFGPRYRQLTAHLQDAHRAAGSGWGFTFPGDVRHLAAFYRPWMRIDYALASPHWTIHRFALQDQAADSQHLGLVIDASLR